MTRECWRYPSGQTASVEREKRSQCYRWMWVHQNWEILAQTVKADYLRLLNTFLSPQGGKVPRWKMGCCSLSLCFTLMNTKCRSDSADQATSLQNTDRWQFGSGHFFRLKKGCDPKRYLSSLKKGPDLKHLLSITSRCVAWSAELLQRCVLRAWF